MIEFTFKSGARKGSTARIAEETIVIGRHPKSDLRFDTQRDLSVSTKHATITKKGTSFVLRDEGSRNGTFVNRKRLNGSCVLKEGDLIRFGANGPEVVIHLKPDIVPPHTVEEPVHMRPSTAQRVKLEVERQTKTLRRVALASVTLLVLVGGAFAAFSVQQRRERQAELDDMTARADSIRDASDATIAGLTSEVQDLITSFREAQTEVQQLRGELEQAGGADDEEMDRLRAALAAAEGRQRAMTTAAGIDYQAAESALAVVIVEFADGERTIGTAFGVDPARLLVTARHVVAGPEGTSTARRIAIKFSRSPQWFQGQIVRLAEDRDLAVIRVRLSGTIPTVEGFSITPPTVGSPVAMLGFPHGLDLPMEGEGVDALVRPTLTAGLVSRVIPATIQINGYSAPGASGSPVFSADGRVVGVIVSGQRESGGQLVFAEPASAVQELVRQVR